MLKTATTDATTVKLVSGWEAKTLKSRVSLTNGRNLKICTQEFIKAGP